jgi:hypothetical protein
MQESGQPEGSERAPNATGKLPMETEMVQGKRKWASGELWSVRRSDMK